MQADDTVKSSGLGMPRSSIQDMARPDVLEEIEMGEIELTKGADVDLKKLASAYREILGAIGEDVGRDGLLDTPMRAAKAFKFLTKGYEEDLKVVVNGAVFPESTEAMVVVHNIPFHSLCEHHLLPFMGRVHIAYLPQGKVLGLSKLARITHMFARRLQVQERLTKQIALAVQETAGARGVAVVVDATHMCMEMRGVRSHGSTTSSQFFGGVFDEDPKTRDEFFQHIRRSRL